jgi:hypothetical protein
MFSLDIYGLSDKKDNKVIELFLSEFTYRDQIEARAGDIVTIFSNEKYNVYKEDIAIETTTDLINLGVRNRNKGFCAYFHRGLKPDITSLLLKFTYDDKIIYGVSVDESNESRARDVRDKLITDFCVKDVSIEFENPPADDEAEFYENKEAWKDTLTR